MVAPTDKISVYSKAPQMALKTQAQTNQTDQRLRRFLFKKKPHVKQRIDQGRNPKKKNSFRHFDRVPAQSSFFFSHYFLFGTTKVLVIKFKKSFLSPPFWILLFLFFSLPISLSHWFWNAQVTSFHNRVFLLSLICVLLPIVSIKTACWIRNLEFPR